MYCISGPSARWDGVLTKNPDDGDVTTPRNTLRKVKTPEVEFPAWLSDNSHANWASGHARALTVTDLCLHLFHMLLKSGQDIARFVTCEVLIAYAASGTCYYEDLALLNRFSILLPLSLPAAARFPFFCSYTAISTEGVGVLLGYGGFKFFVCELLSTSSSMLSFCRFDRNIRKRLTCRSRADPIYNYSCLRSHHMIFPPALLTFFKLPGL